MTRFRQKIKFWLAGSIVGFVNGLFGGGGGMICVPALNRFLKLETKKAHATAVAVMLPISVVSGCFYLTFGGLDWSLLAQSAFGVLLGGVLGTVLLRKLQPRAVRIVFSVLLAVAGLRMLIG